MVVPSGNASNGASAECSALLREAVSASRMGHKARARAILSRIHREDPANEQAWLFSASLADSEEEASRSLAEAIRLNPNNDQAITTLALHRLNTAVAGWDAATRSEQQKAAYSSQPLSLVLSDEVLAEKWLCPLCRSVLFGAGSMCSRCGGVTRFDDLRAFTEERPVDQKLLVVALEQAKREVAFEPGTTAYLNLARVYLNMNQSADALPWLERVAKTGSSPAIHAAVEQLACRPLVLAVVHGKETRRQLLTIIERLEYRVSAVGNGAGALSRLEEFTPDLIVLDDRLPRMNGYKTCRTIRQRLSGSNIPVVLLGSDHHLLDRMKARVSGASAFINKPFTFGEVESVLTRVCPAK